MTDLVTYAVTDGVAHLGLNRPAAANAFDLPTARAFAAAVDRAATDDAVRAVLVTGAGPRFCAGGDVASFVAADEPAAYLHDWRRSSTSRCRRWPRLPKPVVAAVHGAVAGAGLALMLSCDVIVAAEQTKFVFAYPGVGLTPDCGVSYLLPRAVGQQRALGFALGNSPIGADQALDWGLVTEVDPDPAARAREVVGALAAGPAQALGQARRLLRAGWELDRAATGAEEARTISASVSGAEASELIARFVAR